MGVRFRGGLLRTAVALPVYGDMYTRIPEPHCAAHAGIGAHRAALREEHKVRQILPCDDLFGFL